MAFAAPFLDVHRMITYLRFQFSGRFAETARCGAKNRLVLLKPAVLEVNFRERPQHWAAFFHKWTQHGLPRL